MLGSGAAQSLLFWWKRKHKRTYELVWLLNQACSFHTQAAQSSISLTAEHAGYSAGPVARAAYCQRALPLLAVPGSLVLLHGEHRLHAVAVHAATHTADHAAPGAPWRPGRKGCWNWSLCSKDAACIESAELVHVSLTLRQGIPSIAKKPMSCCPRPASTHLLCTADLPFPWGRMRRGPEAGRV